MVLPGGLGVSLWWLFLVKLGERVRKSWVGTITVCTAFEVLGCSGRTVMTRGAGTTSAWVVPVAWPGSVVPGASSAMSHQSRLSDFLGGRDSSEVLAAGGAENTKVVGVPLGLGTCFSISGGTGCTGPYFLFS